MISPDKLQLLTEAQQAKQVGNQAFGDKDYKNAIRMYYQAILKLRAVKPSFVDGMFEKNNDMSRYSDKEVAFVQECKKTQNLCLLNLAACIIAQPNRKSEDYSRAARYCDEILDEDPTNAKAFYRKGVALYMAGNYHAALDVLRVIDKKYNGKDEKIHGYLLMCQEKMKDGERQLKERLSKAFENNSSNSPSTSNSVSP